MEKIVITPLKKKLDGTYHVEIKRPYRTENRTMTAMSFREYIVQTQNYCKHKGYKLQLDFRKLEVERSVFI